MSRRRGEIERDRTTKRAPLLVAADASGRSVRHAPSAPINSGMSGEGEGEEGAMAMMNETITRNYDDCGRARCDDGT